MFCENLMPVQKSKNITTNVGNQVFNNLHHKIDRFHALLKYFLPKTHQEEYQMDQNVKTGSIIDNIYH